MDCCFGQTRPHAQFRKRLILGRFLATIGAGNLSPSPRMSIMRERLRLLLRSALYAMRGGFLIRPFLIALALGAAGAILSSAEEYTPALNLWIPQVLFPAHQDPQVALSIFVGIASSIMTVVSILFASGLMTLTLASTQFSPRILISFVRDRATQWTLGVFLGTFSCCMAALPAVRSLPQPYAPVLTVLIAMALALVCVGWPIFFINHISRSISVNHIVDRIAGETARERDRSWLRHLFLTLLVELPSRSRPWGLG